MWPSSPARAWARRASMVSSMPDSFSARRVLSSPPVSIVVVMAGGGAAARVVRAVMTLPQFLGVAACSGTTLPAAGPAANRASGPCRNAATPPSPAGAVTGVASVPAVRMPLTVR